jgi:hypothetical protein
MSKTPAIFLLLCMFAPALYSQNGASAVERAHTDAINDRLRAQRADTPKPTSSTAPALPSKYDRMRMLKKNQELKALMQSVENDIALADRGVLAADLTKKLKRVEKLAKELRQEFE